MRRRASTFLALFLLVALASFGPSPALGGVAPTVCSISVGKNLSATQGNLTHYYDFSCYSLTSTGLLAIFSLHGLVPLYESTLSTEFIPQIAISPSSICYTLFPFNNDGQALPGQCIDLATARPQDINWAGRICADYHYNFQDELSIIDSTACFQCSVSYYGGVLPPAPNSGCYFLNNGTTSSFPNLLSSASTTTGLALASALGRDPNGNLFWFRVQKQVDDSVLHQTRVTLSSTDSTTFWGITFRPNATNGPYAAASTDSTVLAAAMPWNENSTIVFVAHLLGNTQVVFNTTIPGSIYGLALNRDGTIVCGLHSLGSLALESLEIWCMKGTQTLNFSVSYPMSLAAFPTLQLSSEGPASYFCVHSIFLGTINMSCGTLPSNFSQPILLTYNNTNAGVVAFDTHLAGKWFGWALGILGGTGLFRIDLAQLNSQGGSIGINATHFCVSALTDLQSSVSCINISTFSSLGSFSLANSPTIAYRNSRLAMSSPMTPVAPSAFSPSGPSPLASSPTPSLSPLPVPTSVPSPDISPSIYPSSFPSPLISPLIPPSIPQSSSPEPALSPIITCPPLDLAIDPDSVECLNGQWISNTSLVITFYTTINVPVQVANVSVTSSSLNLSSVLNVTGDVILNGSSLILTPGSSLGVSGVLSIDSSSTTVISSSSGSGSSNTSTITVGGCAYVSGILEVDLSNATVGQEGQISVLSSPCINGQFSSVIAKTPNSCLESNTKARYDTTVTVVVFRLVDICSSGSTLTGFLALVVRALATLLLVD